MLNNFDEKFLKKKIFFKIYKNSINNDLISNTNLLSIETCIEFKYIVIILTK